jgi:hypothetical protein
MYKYICALYPVPHLYIQTELNWPISILCEGIPHIATTHTTMIQSLSLRLVDSVCACTSWWCVWPILLCFWVYEDEVYSICVSDMCLHFMIYKQFCVFLCPLWQVRGKVKMIRVMIEKGSRYRSDKCAAHLLDTGYVKNGKIISFSSELHQHSQPPDQGLFRPFRNFCHTNL